MYVQVSDKLRRGLKEAKKQAKRALDMTVTVRECSLLSHTLSFEVTIIIIVHHFSN